MFLISKDRQLNEDSVIPAWIAGTRKPGMVCVAHIHVAWIPAIHAGMTKEGMCYELAEDSC